MITRFDDDLLGEAIQATIVLSHVIDEDDIKKEFLKNALNIYPPIKSRNGLFLKKRYH
ncbi:hypothetical protein ADIWIN_1416 [Winogradskyella psychrotolerans RS-3]|uniref:Uncharacterized protein n=1 Tax=Winogradskyella psychrotolerans RS-3 TaxID=641526 RepID=S7VTJ0_9FLAO|nr:hypothetical protein ADIWIN_1416 [Winogradskyella psychrotolerans RS-3]